MASGFPIDFILRLSAVRQDRRNAPKRILFIERDVVAEQSLRRRARCSALSSFTAGRGQMPEGGSSIYTDADGYQAHVKDILDLLALQARDFHAQAVSEATLRSGDMGSLRRSLFKVIGGS